MEGQIIRLVDASFINAMDDGLERGRKKGRVGWDRNWINTKFDSTPTGPNGQIMNELHRQYLKLKHSVLKSAQTGGTLDSRQAIKIQAANVANLAMMVADIHEALY